MRRATSSKPGGNDHHYRGVDSCGDDARLDRLRQLEPAKIGRMRPGLGSVNSERRLQARVKGAWPRRAERTRVREWRAAVGEIGHGAGIEECSVGRIAVIEDVVRARIDLERLVDLIRSVQVENGIRGEPLRLIGFVPHKVLAADKQRIASNLEGVSDRVIDTGLDSIARDCRDSIARQDLDCAVDVGKWTVGTDLQRVKEARVHKGIADIELQCLRCEIDLSLNALAARRTHVLEIAKSLQRRTGNREDVILVVRAEYSELPSKRADVQLFR